MLSYNEKDEVNQVAIDCETTGVDLRHGSRPFFVSACVDGNLLYWEWDVDPFTREVTVPRSELDEIHDVLRSADQVVMQNGKFDVHALTSVDDRFEEWPWDRTVDTMWASHLLDSLALKDSTILGVRWCGVDVSPLEDALAREVKRLRRPAKELGWAIASADRDDMPSAKSGDPWRADYWLPRAMEPGSTVLRDYGNSDTEVTLAVWKEMAKEIERRELTKIFKSRMQLMPVLWEMERDGLTVRKAEFLKIAKKYKDRSDKLGTGMIQLVESLGGTLSLPKGSSVNKSLTTAAYDVINLPPMRTKKSKGPTLSKDALQKYVDDFPDDTPQHLFSKSLLMKRQVDTSLSYIESYRRFWKPIGREDVNRIGTLRSREYATLYPSINGVGTNTLRCSSSNPNEQNFGKKKDGDGVSIRDGLGPLPGRVWFSMDYENLELRLPAYRYDETEMVALFEKPDEAPFFGSYHLLVAETLWPKEFAACLREGVSFKDKYKSTLYQWVKNGNFAVQYGAVPESGTADRAYHQAGAHRRLLSRFTKIAAANKRAVQRAQDYGYVETFPDRTVDPDRGYPLVVPRDWNGRVEPTKPFSYEIQGTAMWVTTKASIDCRRLLQQWNEPYGRRQYRIAIQVHDELDFDFPDEGRRNLPKVATLRRTMERVGDAIGVPLKVDVSYHPVSWGREEEMKF